MYHLIPERSQTIQVSPNILLENKRLKKGKLPFFSHRGAVLPTEDSYLPGGSLIKGLRVLSSFLGNLCRLKIQIKEILILKIKFRHFPSLDIRFLTPPFTKVL